MAEMSAAKRNADRMVREFRAMALLACNMTRKLREEIDAELKSIPALKTSALQNFVERMDKMIHVLRQKLGALKPMAAYLELADDMAKHPGLMLWIQKQVIDTELFSKLSAVDPKWHRFPPHTRLGVDYHGEMPNSLEWRLLDAALFESAALLWNDVLLAAEEEKQKPDNKMVHKRYREMKRSTIRAIFALIEGYLNGIAYDITLTTDISALSVGARELLLERSDDGKARFKTLREKILSYPRIALGLEHSPVQENNRHVAYLLEHERELRDAFVHPTPRVDPARPEPRETTYFDFEQSEVSSLVDHAIGLIRYIDGILNGRFGKADIWLVDREADGKFPPKTFD